MTARVLVVDDIAANLKLLEARLTAEYFDVVTATNGAGRARNLRQRRLRHRPARRHDAGHERLRGLPPPEGGSGDAAYPRRHGDGARPGRRQAGGPRGRRRRFSDEADRRDRPSRAGALACRGCGSRSTNCACGRCRRRNFGIEQSVHASGGSATSAAAFSWSTTAARRARRSSALSRASTRSRSSRTPLEALVEGAAGGYDLFIVSLSLAGLRRPAAVQPAPRRSRRPVNFPILAIAEPEDRARMLRGLDLGVNDYLLRPIDRNELIARVRTQIRRKRYADHLRQDVESSIEMAVVDALTGLHNRRYLDSVLASLVEEARRKSQPLAADDLRHRPLQDGQRRLWPCGRRSAAAGTGGAASRI